MTWIKNVKKRFLHLCFTLRLCFSNNVCSQTPGKSATRGMDSWLHDIDSHKKFGPDLLLKVFTARRLAERGICRRRMSVSLCVCVCVSVTLRYCIKTAKCRITQIMPHDSPLILVFWRKSSWQNLNEINPYGGDKCRWGGLKLVTFHEKRAITWKRYKIDV